MPAHVRSSLLPRRASGQDVPKPAAVGPARVLVAVDKTLVRQGLVRLLETGAAPVDIQASADARATRECMRRHVIELLLIGPAQAREVGAAALHAYPCRIVLVTARDHVGEAPIAGRETACGMLSESDDEAGTRALLRTVAECPRVAFSQDRCCGCLVQRTWQQARLPLSPRERDVFLRIGAGAGPARMAADLGLSVKTIESHCEKIKHKLGLDSALALQCAAQRWRQGYALADAD